MRRNFGRFPHNRYRTYTNHIGVTHPELAKEFDVEKNVEFKIENITQGSQKLVWWECSKCGTSWTENAFKRVRGKGKCPNCSVLDVPEEKTLAYLYPHLIDEWNQELNGKFTPYNIYAGSGREVNWKCQECGFQWATRVSSRSSGKSGCPVCSRKKHREHMKARERFARPNNLKELYPSLEKCFDIEKNYPIELEHLTKGSNRMIHWMCPSCSHPIKVKVASFIKHLETRKCEKCENKLFEGKVN